MILFSMIKRILHLKKRNKIAIDLFTNKYRKRIIKPKKKVRVVLKERKNKLIYPSSNNLNYFGRHFGTFN